MGCQKCYIIGVYFSDVRRTAFAEFDCELRSDFDFRSRKQFLHHKCEKSPLEEMVYGDGNFVLDMIKDFPTSDPLHLLEEGLMKRLLKIWMKEKVGNCKRKWSESQKLVISNMIRDANKELPSEIHRSIRSLEYIAFWKATEFRVFLLYGGVVIFKDHLPAHIYEHFLTLFCAVRLCSCEAYVRKKNYMGLARALFTDYAKEYANIYGDNSIVSNVHNIVHIADDIDRFGCLNNIATYPFENHLRHIKLLIQNSNLPLEQIARRLVEISINSKTNPINFNTLQFENSVFTPIPKYPFKYSDFFAFKSLQITPSVILSNRKFGDKWFLTIENELVEMICVIVENNSIFVYGYGLQHKTDFFEKPFFSHHMDIFFSEGKENQRSDIKYPK